MPEFEIHVTKQIFITATVQAKSRKEAERKVNDMLLTQEEDPDIDWEIENEDLVFEDVR
jgi:hypothetical protein